MFLPGVIDKEVIEANCRLSPLSANALNPPSSFSVVQLASMGVSRIRFGPWQYCMMQHHFHEQMEAAHIRTRNVRPDEQKASKGNNLE